MFHIKKHKLFHLYHFKGDIDHCLVIFACFQHIFIVLFIVPVNGNCTSCLVYCFQFLITRGCIWMNLC